MQQFNYTSYKAEKYKLGEGIGCLGHSPPPPLLPRYKITTFSNDCIVTTNYTNVDTKSRENGTQKDGQRTLKRPILLSDNFKNEVSLLLWNVDPF